MSQVKAAAVTAVATVTAAGILAGSAIYTGYLSVGRESSASKSVASGPSQSHASVSITAPAPGNTVPICYTVEGRATLEETSQNVIVGMREKSGSRWYFEPQATWDYTHTRWKSSVTLGELGDEKARDYKIVALVVGKPFEDYLATTNPERNSSGEAFRYWSSPGLPEDWTAAKDVVDVSRSSLRGEC